LQAEALKNDYIVYIFDAFGDVSKYIKHLISTRVDGIFVSAAPDFLSDERFCGARGTARYGWVCNSGALRFPVPFVPLPAKAVWSC